MNRLHNRSVRRLQVFVLIALTAAVVVALNSATPASSGAGSTIQHRRPASLAGVRAADGLANIEHVIVIYQENWSFDSLYGKFPGANGIDNAMVALAANPQIDAYTNQPLTKLPPPLLGATLDPRFPNFNQPPAPFNLTDFIPPSAFTGDTIHAFFTHQAQINGGKMDKFVSLSDNGGLVMGYFDATNLPEGLLAQQFVMCDNFFQAAFGGSYLNHHYLIAARAPFYDNAPPAFRQPAGTTQHNGNFGFDDRGNPFSTQTPLGQSANAESFLTTDDFSVNTQQPTSPLSLPVPIEWKLPPQHQPTIGDRLVDAGISWAWYAGGFAAATSGAPNGQLIYHHHPFLYYANFAPGTAFSTAFLKDETDFMKDLKSGRLPSVSFIKADAANDGHPGYSNILLSQNYVASIVTAVQNSPYWPKTAIIVTYDENGGHYDHVPPPSAAQNSPPGTYDRFGPGSRIPAIIISPFAKRGFVDHTPYDTTSVLRFIEKRWNLPPLSTRDAAVNSLDNAFDFSHFGISDATATPSTVGIGQTVSFAVKLTGVLSSTATVTWDFGDPNSPATATGASTSHAYIAPGVYTVRVTASDGVSPDDTTTLVVIVRELSIAGLTATPTIAGTGQTINFAVNVLSRPNPPVAIVWDFGDPNNTATASGPLASHAYAVSGAYDVRVTASDGINPDVSQTIEIHVNKPMFGLGFDFDGDGFSNASENIFASDPANPQSTPVGAPITTPHIAADWTGAKVRVSFRSHAGSHDIFEFSGSLPVPAGFNFDGKSVLVDFGGELRQATLLPGGRAIGGGDSFVFQRPRNGRARFRARFKGTGIAQSLIDEGFINENVSGSPLSVTVTVAFNGHIYAKKIDLTYNAKKDRFGAAE